jgi:dynein heavy chain
VELVTHTWLPQVKQLGIPSSAAFDFALFLADQSDVRDWNIQGLPADDFSTENGVVVTRGRRWQGLTDVARHVIEWRSTKDARIQQACRNVDDVASNVCQALAVGRC